MIAVILIVLDFIFQRIYSPVPDGIPMLPKILITFAGVLASSILYSRQMGGKLSFGEVFSHGLRTTAVIAFLMALYTFLAVKFIYPAPSAAEMDAAVKAIEQQGNALHHEAAEQATNAARHRWIIYVSLSIFATLIPGLLGSLAGAAITKKNQ